MDRERRKWLAGFEVPAQDVAVVGPGEKHLPVGRRRNRGQVHEADLRVLAGEGVKLFAARRVPDADLPARRGRDEQLVPGTERSQLGGVIEAPLFLALRVAQQHAPLW